MTTVHEELLQVCAELRRACGSTAGEARVFHDVSALTSRLARLAGTPEISAAALEVRFKAEDLFRRAHLMSESILRLMLEDRLQRLEAHVGVLAAGIPHDRRAPGQSGRRSTDRAPALGVTLPGRRAARA